jgi:hypothetical protein
MAKGCKTGGRTKGTPNKITAAFKEAVLRAYDGIGGDDAFMEWARQNPTQFYQIASRLIPQEMRYAYDGTNTINVQVVRFSDLPENTSS